MVEQFMSLLQIIYFLETIIDSNFEKVFTMCICNGYNKLLFKVQMTCHHGIR